MEQPKSKPEPREEDKPLKDRYNPVNMAGREAGIIEKHEQEKEEERKGQPDKAERDKTKRAAGKPDAEEQPPRRR